MTDIHTSFLSKFAELEKRIEKLETYVSPGTRRSSKVIDDGEHDSLFPDAVKLIEGQETASASLFQRRMQVGYARAARILDELHDAGYVGPPIGAHPRKVLQRST